MKKILIVITLFIFSAELINAQPGLQWRSARHEFIIGLGATNFLGELGGADAVGTNTMRDFNYESTRYLFNAGYRYKLADAWAVRGSVFYGRLYGDDRYTEEIHRSSRNMHFRSPIVEIMADIQFSIVRERFARASLLRVMGDYKNRPNFYIFTGVCGIYFNPKAQYTDGQWYALQPLGTEGQGRIPTREKYSRISVAIPIGLGLNYMIDENFGIGFEYSHRYAFTDYIDDVSTTYVDPEIFGDDYLAKHFSNPPMRDGGEWEGSIPGAQRGNPGNNDAYIFFTLNLTYKIRPGLPGLPMFY